LSVGDGIGQPIKLIPVFEHASKILNLAGIKVISPIIYSPTRFNHSFIKHFNIPQLNYEDYKNF
jgi:hypothetical protein